MNTVLTSKDLKSKSPILSCNAAVFTLGGCAIACRSSVFERLDEVEKFVDEHAGRLVIFDQPNLFTPDLPKRDSDRFILRYALLPDFHGLISRLHNAAPDVPDDLRKELVSYFERQGAAEA